MINDIKDFNDKFQIKCNEAPGFLPDEEMRQRLDFQMEELLETAHACGFYFDSNAMEFMPSMPMLKVRDLPATLDGIVDQMYVLIGTAAKMGFLNPPAKVIRDEWYPFPTVLGLAWKRVHRANMKKEIVPGMWKVQKPSGWKAPELGDLV